MADGFADGARYVGIPAAYLSHVLPEVRDLAELQMTLYVFGLLSQSRARPPYVTLSVLGADPVLARALEGAAGPAQPGPLHAALGAALKRGVFLAARPPGSAETCLLLNTPRQRRTLEAQGWTPRAALSEQEGTPSLAAAVAPSRPNIFALYEDTIGLLSPTIADLLREAEARYPEAWVWEAFSIAAQANVRKWSYVAAILGRWEGEGRGAGPGEPAAVERDLVDYYLGQHRRLQPDPRERVRPLQREPRS